MGVMKYITFNKISIQFKMIYINLEELKICLHELISPRLIHKLISVKINIMVDVLDAKIKMTVLPPLL